MGFNSGFKGLNKFTFTAGPSNATSAAAVSKFMSATAVVMLTAAVNGGGGRVHLIRDVYPRSLERRGEVWRPWRRGAGEFHVEKRN